MAKKLNKTHERKELKEEEQIIKIAKKMKRDDKAMLKKSRRK